MTTDFDELDDHQRAVQFAQAAGRRLLAVRAEQEASGADRSLTKAAGDAAAQTELAALLAEHCPADAVLSEEAADDPARLQADRVWIIDPLDGTREFSEFGRDDWAVHVALWQAGELIAGAVDLPARGQTLSTGAPPELPDRAPGPIRLAVSRSRPPAFVTEVANQLGADLVPMGSAGVKAMSVLTGETDAYVHAGGQYQWDSAAPVAVAAAAGLFTSRIDGSPLRYNDADPYLPDLVVARPEVADRVLEAIRQVG